MELNCYPESSKEIVGSEVVLVVYEKEKCQQRMGGGSFMIEFR